ncbi:MULTISPECIES: tetratricopeptide repeat protein [Dyella]|uniref:protein O-GlcNAc transferase n=2 Tax=Dyella TaxID=231454 RepID=A0A4R0YGX2_9GAMM|nr:MULTISPECIES: tetratricopeptide repeat protein [Dyella]TBR37260.1 tetratricopeptide repeat protein [Dyella terrae]TCI07650.1 tetratricopeptide repeat protein [Dyella soli]
MTQAARTALLAHQHRIAQLLDRNEAGEAEASALRARTEFPQDAELARLHSHALHFLGRPVEAREALNQAAAIAPDSIEVQCSFANLDMDEGHTEAAIERLRATLRRQPGHPAVLLVLGNALMAAARYAQARESFAMATHGAPAHAGLRLNLASAELELGNYEQARKHVDEALELAPRFDGAYAMQGRVWQSMGQPKRALESWMRAEALAPGQPQYSLHVGLLLDELGDPAGAAAAFQRSLAIQPDAVNALAMLVFAKRRTFDWVGLEALADRLHAAVERRQPGALPFAYLAEDATAKEQRQCAETFAATVEHDAVPLRQHMGLTHVTPKPSDPIRVGFVSNGFGDRPMGHLTVGLLEALRSEQLDVHLFSLAPDETSQIRLRLAATTSLHDVSTHSTIQLAKAIHEQRIEVLFDLRTFGSGANSDLFELRPAPVQVNWLAYPATSGARWTDYQLTDATALPATLREHFSEKIVRLPRCALPYTPVALPQAPSRQASGLPETATVYACFSGSHKLNPASFSRFMLILERVPDSVLWLYSEDDASMSRLRMAAEAMGIKGSRLVFAPRLPHAAHLARLRQADLFLDTSPCNAQSTALDALWAGCPVLTMVGYTLSGRQGASLLFHANLPELVAEDEDSFVAQAVQLGNDRQALALLRRHLERGNERSTLFDTAGFTMDFRRAIQAMSARYRIGRPPIDIDL